MTIMNVFRQDAFSGLTLSAMIDRAPFKPTGLGELKLFDDKPIYTTALAVEDRQGKLVLIATSPRGAAPVERVEQKRNARYFETPRLAHADTIYATELQNIREPGSEAQLKTLQSEIAFRAAGSTGLTASMEYTWEYHRLAAIDGLLLDSSGATLFDWYAEFNITRPSTIDFNLGGWKPGASVATQDGALRILCNTIVRRIARAAQGAFTTRSRVMAACGDMFWDELTTHPDVTKTYFNWMQAQELRKGSAFESMHFGGIDWFNYRGSDDASTISIPTNACRIFPADAPGIFQRALAPAEFMPFVNTRGKPLYLLPSIDTTHADAPAWWRMTAYSYPLHICLRPEVLQRGTTSS